jgi:hypothetical protein
MKHNYFLNMVQHLRQHEEIMLFGNIVKIDDNDAAEVAVYLQEEYRKESQEYPYTAPPFDVAAALWAAKTMNMAAQLLLFRENKPEDLNSLFPPYENELTASALLSADLCLRFLPDTVRELKLIDSMDSLIQLLENILATWHYSGVGYTLDKEQLTFETVASDPCMRQLYINRIIYYKNIQLAKHPVFRDRISADMGIFANDFWKEFQLEKQTHEQH